MEIARLQMVFLRHGLRYGAHPCTGGERRQGWRPFNVLPQDEGGGRAAQWDSGAQSNLVFEKTDMKTSLNVVGEVTKVKISIRALILLFWMPKLFVMN